MLLAGSTRFLFLGFCTGTPREGERPHEIHAGPPGLRAGRISLVWLCKLPGTQTAMVGGWWSWTARALAPGERSTAWAGKEGFSPRTPTPRPPPGQGLMRTCFQWPSLVFPSGGSEIQGGSRPGLPPFTRAAQWAQGCADGRHAAQHTPSEGGSSTRAHTLAQAFATWVMLHHCCPSGSSTNVFKPRLRRAGGFPRRTLLHTGNSHTLNAPGEHGASLGQRRKRACISRMEAV